MHTHCLEETKQTVDYDEFVCVSPIVSGSCKSPTCTTYNWLLLLLVRLQLHAVTLAERGDKWCSLLLLFSVDHAAQFNL